MSKIAIIGCRGVPNRYGGFEELAEKLALHFSEANIELDVYTVSDHPVSNYSLPNIRRIKIYNPESTFGHAGQFIYDLLCVLKCRKNNYDAILNLGYTTMGVWSFLFPKNTKVITNMDGLEWQRSKYKGMLKWFLSWSEKQCVKHSNNLIADHLEIKSYLQSKYKTPCTFIAYGSDIPTKIESKEKTKSYYLIIARFQSDNNIETIIEGFVKSKTNSPLKIVGNYANGYGRRMMQKFQNSNIHFLGSIFDQKELNDLRQNCTGYFHGHSAGGTNPSLIQAMAAGCKIIAHKNQFNEGVLKSNAIYFSNANDISDVILNATEHLAKIDVKKQITTVTNDYNWPSITKQYKLLLVN